MKKILHISKYYYPYKGGIEDVCKSIVDGLPEYEQRVLCVNDGPDDVVEPVGNAQVIRKGLFTEVCRQPIAIGLGKSIRATIHRFKPDIIHLHAPNPLATLFVCLFIPRRTKLIVHWHSDIVVQQFIYRFFRPIERWCLRRADRVIVTSPTYASSSAPLKRHLHKCVVVPNVISLEKLKESVDEEQKIQAIREKYGNKPIIFFMGRHVEYKGIPHLIEAEKYIKSDCVILIAGTGPLSEKISELTEERPRVKLLGRLRDEDVRVYMKASTVFAFPSVTKNEAFGVVLAEAMYCGAVPVTFTIPGSGVNWVSVHKQTGLEVANGEVKAYAAAIDKLITDTNLRERLSIMAQKRAKDNFVWDVVKGTLTDLYESL